MLFILTDDQRADDLRELPTVKSWIRDQGIEFANHYTDSTTCAPARASIFNGYPYQSHLISLSPASDYYRYDVQGKRVNSSWWAGPWQYQMTGAARQTGDDLTASTGSFHNQLVANFPYMVTGLFCKLQNGHGRDDNVGGVDYGSYDGAGTACTAGQFPIGARRVPPDWHYAYVKVGGGGCGPGPTLTGNWDGGDQDNYDGWYVEKFEGDRSNIGTNVDAYAIPTESLYNRPITVGTHVGTAATITVAGHDLLVGDKISVVGCTPSTYNTPAPSVGVPGTEATVTAVSGNTVTYTCATAPSGNMTVFGTCYSSKHYETNHVTDRLISFLDRRTEGESWFAYFALGTPHQGASDAVEVEQKYVGTVSPSARFRYHDVDGQMSPNGLTGDTLGQAPDQWLQRQESLKSLDDNVAKIKTYLESRGWDGRTIIVFASDQGAHYGEHGYWIDSNSKYFVKDTAYEPCKPLLYVRHPRWQHGQKVTKLTHHFDLPLSILDWYGLTSHAMHTNRNGVSLAKVMADGHPYPNRGLVLAHHVQSVDTVDAFIDADGWKWINAVTTVEPERLYYVPSDPDEVTNLLPHTNVANVITSFVVVSNVATVTTTTAHGLSPKDYTTISGMSPAGYNIDSQILTVPSPTTFTAVTLTSSTVTTLGQITDQITSKRTSAVTRAAAMRSARGTTYRAG